MRWLLVTAAAVALVGCKSETVEHYPRPDAGDVTPDVADDAADGSGADAPPVDPQWAGLPCETNQDCGPAPRQCITRQFLDTMGVNPEIDLPGGMCSRLLCSSNDDCGPDGLCFDAESLGAPGIRICLAACEDITDCRWREAWDCMPLSQVLDDATPEDGGACVSDSLQVAIICDDGHCEEEGSQ